MLRGCARRWLRGLAAVLALAGLLLATLPGPTVGAHAVAPDPAVAVGAAQPGPPQVPCQPGEPHGTPCCQASACTTLATPAPTTQAVIAPGARDVVTFAPLRLQRIAGIAPHPGMRPPRAAV